MSPYDEPNHGAEPVRDAELVDDSLSTSDVTDGEPRRVGHPVLAWLVIAAIVALILAVATVRERVEEESELGERWQASVMEWQGKYLVGVSRFPGMPAQRLLEQVDQLDTGSLTNRLRHVVLVGELGDAEKAAARLEDLERRVRQSPTRPTDEQRGMLDALNRLYADFQNEQWAAPSLAESERELLVERLGWFGRLALHPEPTDAEQARREVLREATRTVPVTVLGTLLFLALGLASLGGLIGFIVLFSMGRLSSRLEPGGQFGGVYVETFALWMAAYVAMSVVVQRVVADRPGLFLPALAIGMVLSGLTMFWPLLRTVSWTRMRDEIGLTRGRHSLVEMALGVVGWLATLPVLLIVLLVTLGILSVVQPAEPGPADPFAPQQVPAHPIVEWVLQAGVLGKLLIVLVACILAPIVEEIMFRGFLYRHLREATRRRRMASSILFSALFSSVLFAAIHPQGVIAVPALSTLAGAFCLLREWRGSLIAPITAHAINNGVVTLMLLMLIR